MDHYNGQQTEKSHRNGAKIIFFFTEQEIRIEVAKPISFLSKQKKSRTRNGQQLIEVVPTQKKSQTRKGSKAKAFLYLNRRYVKQEMDTRL